MIRNFFAVILAYAGIAAYAFTGNHHKEAKTSITGKINPAEGVEMVWVISGKDSLKSPTSAGLFTFEVKPGIHLLVVDAKNPYKDVILDQLSVSENEVLDLGEIVLSNSVES
jgi:hypothetical protein